MVKKRTSTTCPWNTRSFEKKKKKTTKTKRNLINALNAIFVSHWITLPSHFYLVVKVGTLNSRVACKFFCRFQSHVFLIRFGAIATNNSVAFT